MTTGQSIAAPMSSTGSVQESPLGGALTQHALPHPPDSLLGAVGSLVLQPDESQQQLTSAADSGPAGEAAMLFMTQQHSGMAAASSSTMHRWASSLESRGMTHHPTITRFCVQACIP